MISRTKKGYALLTTMVVMFLVLAISTVLITFAGNYQTSANTTKTNFENKQKIIQIAQNFVDNSTNDFIIKYSDYTQTINFSVTLLTKENITMELWEANSTYNLKVFINDSLKGEVSKNNLNNILLWKIT